MQRLDHLRRACCLTFACAALWVVAGCSGEGTAGQLAPPVERQDVTAAELQAMIDDGNPLTLADVRTAGEYATGHVPGTVNLCSCSIETWSAALDKNARICCICAVGGRSAGAADTLIEKGFTQVYNLLGGMGSWPGPVEQ